MLSVLSPFYPQDVYGTDEGITVTNNNSSSTWLVLEFLANGNTIINATCPVFHLNCIKLNFSMTRVALEALESSWIFLMEFRFHKIEKIKIP